MGFHTGFDGGEDAKVGGGHGAHYCRIKLHGGLFVLVPKIEVVAARV
jgi:hypothetical protein